MDASILALMIPLSALGIPIVAIGAGVVNSVLKSQERRLEMRLRLQQGQNEDVSRQLEELRTEIAKLRDTSTQFDLTMDHTVQRMEERLSRLETRAATQPASAAPDERQQRIGAR